jgi:hypothetical protein
LFLGLAALTGCGREEIRVYTAPKDQPPTALAARDETPPPGETIQRPQPKVTWKLPAVWKEGIPNQISLASFHLSGAGGKEAEVTLTPLPGMMGAETMLVNMWRTNAVGLPAVSEEEALRQLKPVEFAGEKGQLFEVAGTSPAGQAVKIITAMNLHADGSLFCKLSGDPAVVDEQRATFLEFLKSIKIEDAPPAAAPPVAAANGMPAWTPPANWKPMPTPPMLSAQFQVPGPGEARAMVNISIAGGGRLENINRWRNQLALKPVDEAGLAQLTSPVEASGRPGVLVDMSGTDVKTGKPARLVAAMIPQGGQSWFYKLMGDGSVVEKEKASFVQFVQNTKYPNEP